MTKAKARPQHARVQCHNTNPSMTKQSFKDECNINKIMDKFQKTGALDHYASHAPQYGDATEVELFDAMNIVADSNSMFEELPASLRKKFHNQPGEFLKFVQDPKNLEEMRELGLAERAQTTPPAVVEEHSATLAAEEVVTDT